MNDTPLDTNGDGSWGGPSALREEEVRDLLLTLGKALRAHQLYEENNPVYRRFLSALRQSFRHVWTTEDGLSLVVEESRLLLDGAPVYVNANRSESLAFLLYKDGIRHVVMLPGLEEEELERFLSVLHRARHAGAEGDDLLTLLWEQDFRSFRYTYVDYLAEGVIVPEPGAGAGVDQITAVREQELGREWEGGEAGAAPDALAGVGQDLNPTLYALDPREMDQLEREFHLEMSRDLRGDVLSALFDRLEEPEHPERQDQILSIFQAILPSLLARGALDVAARVLEELRSLESRAGVLDGPRRETVTALLEEVSSPDVVGELVRALEDGSVVAAPVQLGVFLSHLEPAALAPLLRASETVVAKDLQPVLRDAVGGIASRNRHELVALLTSEDPLVASGAARLAGRMQVTEAAHGLQDLLRHPDAGARLAAVEAAAMLKASTVAGALQDVLADPDRDVRIAAARALGRLRYRPAARRFRAFVTGKAIRGADITEKIAFFEGYGEIGDPDAVPVLRKLLNGKGLLGRREPTDLRAAAALGLGKVATADARAVLEAAVTDDDPVVRSTVARALREASREP